MKAAWSWSRKEMTFLETVDGRDAAFRFPFFGPIRHWRLLLLVMISTYERFVEKKSRRCKYSSLQQPYYSVGGVIQ